MTYDTIRFISPKRAKGVRNFNNSEKPPNNDIEQYRRELGTYKNRMKKDYCTCFTMLNSIQNDSIN